MNGTDRRRRWTSIKQRLGLKGMGCCGATWSPSSSTLTIMETLQEEVGAEDEVEHHQPRPGSVLMGPGSVVVGPVQAAFPLPGMNLAMALAAERNSRAGGEVGPTAAAAAEAGQVKSLMTLIEETDGVDWSSRRKRERDDKKGTGGGGGDIDWLCCVCMERGKGAAFIPCGHTFCRVCSREMWVNRGSCPICNRPILEILDIF